VLVLGERLPSTKEVTEAMAVVSYYNLPEGAMDALKQIREEAQAAAANPFASPSFISQVPEEDSLEEDAESDDGGPSSSGESRDSDAEDEDLEPQDGLARLFLFVLTALVVGQVGRYFLLR
jgi:hypothetical protein